MYLPVIYLDEQDEDVQMPEMEEPKRVLVMLPNDPQNRPAIAHRTANSAGVMPGQAPGECMLLRLS